MSSAPRDDSSATAEDPGSSFGHSSSQHRPIRWLGLYASVAVFAIVAIVSWFVRDHDPAAGNATLAVGTLSSIALFYFWLLVRSRLSWGVRLAALAIPVIAATGFIALYRWEGLNAELVPQFRLRSVTRERSISRSLIEGAGAQGVASGAATLEYATGEYSSTQFFGSVRNGTHPEVVLPAQWPTRELERLWRIPLGLGWASFAVRDGIAVTLEQPIDASFEQLLAVRLADGKPLWSVQMPGTHTTVPGGAGPRSTPTIAGDLVYGVSSAGMLVAVELSNGAERWRKNLLEESSSTQVGFEKLVSWGRSGSPLVVGDSVVVPLGGESRPFATLAAYTRLDGTQRWRGGQDQISYSSPLLMTLHGYEQIVYVSEQYLGGYDLENGSLLWSYPWDSGSNGPANVSQPVQIDEESIALSKGYLRGSARVRVSRDEAGIWRAEKIWENTRSLKTKLTSCVLHEGFLYGLSEGRLECVAAADGKRQWLERGDFGHGQVLLAGGQLLISTERGELIVAAADPTAYRQLFRQQLLEEDVVWNIPTLAGDLLLMRDSREAVCVRLPVRGGQ